MSLTGISVFKRITHVFNIYVIVIINYFRVHLTVLYIVPNSDGSSHLSHWQKMWCDVKHSLLNIAGNLSST